MSSDQYLHISLLKQKKKQSYTNCNDFTALLRPITDIFTKNHHGDIGFRFVMLPFAIKPLLALLLYRKNKEKPTIIQNGVFCHKKTWIELKLYNRFCLNINITISKIHSLWCRNRFFFSTQERQIVFCSFFYENLIYFYLLPLRFNVDRLFSSRRILSL